ncbi:long-chain acyl-CoA synthetase [Acrasis kona]|uniref:Long-chain acyl-CoA synthetase n=1 Tax=Acrasis kona TaxID=1008807 RepID=A0AAW2ZD67_9EUKA
MVLQWFAGTLLTLIDRIIFTVLYLVKGQKALHYDMLDDPKRNKAVSVKNENGTTDSNIETGVYRNAIAKNGLLTTPIKGCSTLPEIFEYSVKTYANKKCMGKRELIRIEKVTLDKKEFEIPEYKRDITYETYAQVGKRVRDLASGLTAFTGLNSGDKLAIYENTCPEWQLVAQSCFRYGIQVVTVYASLGNEALVHSLNETKVTAIFTGEDLLSNLHKNIVDKVPTLKYVIYNQSKLPGNEAKIPPFNSSLKIVSVEELEQLGRSNQEPTPIKQKTQPEDVAFIMYTSGTTGAPKGVVIKHSNVVATAAGVGHTIQLNPETKDWSYLAYLPLAHILEFVAETYMLCIGACLSYGTARTLSDKGARPCGDLTAHKPKILAGVPRVFDTLKKAVQDIVSDTKKTSPIKRFIFKTAFEAKLDAVRNRRTTPLFDYLVFNKIKHQMGGKVEAVLSGGAPLNPDTQDFIRVCFDSSVIQGYGLTETCAGLSVQSLNGPYQTRNAGCIAACAEVKLVGVPEMGYKHDGPIPQGEVCVRGPHVAVGYYLQPEKTKEEFREHGWFHTGDIGQINKNGTLSIVDRKKNLVKLDHGEYVAIEKLEGIYSNSKYVSPNGVCVYADSSRASCVANVLPQPGVLKRWADSNGIKYNDINDLCENPKAVAEVLKDFNNEAKTNNLQRFEYLTNLKLHGDEWTPENGMLTAAMKLQRNEINKKYKDQIEKLYRK